MTTTKGRPIWQSYSDTGALDVTCPHCGAEPGSGVRATTAASGGFPASPAHPRPASVAATGPATSASRWPDSGSADEQHQQRRLHRRAEDGALR